MSRYEHGRVLAVNETTLGSELVGDHAAGVGSLTVEDPVDFDEDGGWLSINGQVVEYSTYDDDTGEITLKGALDAAAGEGDRVDLWDELRQVVTVDKIAQVELDGDDDNTDPLEAVIPLHLLGDLAEGIRGLRGESVLLEQDGDEWRIVDVLGMAASGASGTQFWQEKPAYTAAASGDQQLTLTHDPVSDSEHVIVNGLTLIQADYTLAGRNLTVPSRTAGDVIDVKYAYQIGLRSSVSPVYGGGTEVGLGGASLSATSIAIPATAQDGDLMVLGIGGAVGQTATCSDPRMTLVTQQTLRNRPASVWTGRVTADRSPIVIQMTTGSGSYNDLYAQASLTVWRGEAGPATVAAVAIAPPSTGTTGLIPGISGDLSGAVCIHMQASGTGGVNASWSKAPEYNYLYGASEVYVAVYAALTTANPVPAQTTPNTDGSDSWFSVVLGLGKV